MSDYFESIGGKAHSPFFCDVVLDKDGAEDSLAHGMGRLKTIAYAGVKDVIEKGILIDFDANHKGRGYDSAVVAAPIEIGGERYICSVVIKNNKNGARFYLHEVVNEKWLMNEGSNTGQNQPQRPKAFANVLQNIVTAKENPSKVVDENGEPLVVYHGSPTGTFNVFGEEKGDSDSYGVKGAHFFTTSKQVADKVLYDMLYGAKSTTFFLYQRHRNNECRYSRKRWE